MRCPVSGSIIPKPPSNCLKDTVFFFWVSSMLLTIGLYRGMAIVNIFRRFGGLVVLVEGNVTVDDRRLFGRSTERPWSTVDGSILFLELVTGRNLGFLFLPLFFSKYGLASLLLNTGDVS
jgi:hypothetical protein